MLTTCNEPGCPTLVMGGRCIEHERRPTRIFVRGRPFTPVVSATTGTAAADDGVAVMTATTSLHTHARAPQGARQLRAAAELLEPS
jgi:hypothetical protein